MSEKNKGYPGNTAIGQSEMQFENTRLHLAARDGDLEECIRAINQDNINIDKLGLDGVTALMLAAMYRHPDIVKYLIFHGANVNQVSPTTGDTALHSITVAARKDPLEHVDYAIIVELLLKCGADKSIKDHHGLTAQDIAPPYLTHYFENDIPEHLQFPLPVPESTDGATKKDFRMTFGLGWPTLHVDSDVNVEHPTNSNIVEEMDDALTHRSTYYHLTSGQIGHFLARQLESQISAFVAVRTGPCCILVRSDWLQDFELSLLQALKTRLAVNYPDNVVEQALYSKLHTSNINPVTIGQLVRERRTDIVTSLGKGRAVVMTAATTQPLDNSIKEFITLDLQMPRFNRERVAHACEAFFPPHEDWRIPEEEWVSFVAPQDFLVIASTLSTEASMTEILASLRTQVTRRLRATMPERSALKLDQLQGMEAAKTWAKHLAADIRSALDGKIAWDRVDRGALLEGAPGVGKTALARALAAEIGIPMIATTVGAWQGAGFLSDMLRAMEKDFSTAAELSPSILFIDELDAIGNRASGGQHDQWVTWGVNHMLALMDGFNSSQRVIVLGATNHAGKIDPALRRSGRLDRSINVPLPNRKALEAMYLHYIGTNDHTITAEDATALAGSSVGISGADVERIIREARRMARMTNRPLSKDDVFKSIYATPPEDQRQPMTSEELRETAYHEAGHAIMIWFSDAKGDGIQYLSIVPRADGTLGFVAQAPSEKKHTLTAKTGKQRLGVLLGGRAAEQVAFGQDNISSGSSSDLKMATDTATFMVYRCGLGPMGMLSVTDKNDEKRDLQVEDLLQESYKAAVQTLTQHRVLLDMVATALVEKSELSGAEFSELAKRYEGLSKS